MDKMTDELRDQVSAAVEAGLTDEALEKLNKAARDIVTQIEEDVVYNLKNSLALELSSFVVKMAEKTIKALLEGNEAEMRRYLSCQEGYYNGRSDGFQIGKRDIADVHPIIHGVLFEQGCIQLRRDVVNAHRDLLVSERIKDLEDQNASLVAQYNKLKADADSAYERGRSFG